MRVRDILATHPERLISVAPDTTLQDAAALMVSERIGVVLVIDDAGDLAGILSERDLVRLVARPGSNKSQQSVIDAATRRLVTCTEDNTLQDVMILMSNNTVRHLPVLRDGRPVGMISARDLMDAQKTDTLAALARQKQAFTLMKRAKEQAERADRTKTEFLSNMSHELRTPLNAIIGFGGIIASQSLGKVGNDRYVEFARDIAASGTKLLNVIDDILAVTRLESGKWLVSDTEIDIAVVVAESAARFADGAAAKDVLLETFPADAAVRLIADVDMVERMLENLLSNALKFTPDGGRVVVGTRLDIDDSLSVFVSDTGVGIPEDAIGTITTPFSQVDGTLTRNYEGTGLGLALVSRMMSAHEGELTVDSAPGAGTTVTLRFPPRRVVTGLGRRAVSG